MSQKKTRTWSDVEIAAAKACLVHQLERWDAERELEVLLVGESTDLETEDAIKGLGACLGAPEYVTDTNAIQLLEDLRPQLVKP